MRHTRTHRLSAGLVSVILGCTPLALMAEGAAAPAEESTWEATQRWSAETWEATKETSGEVWEATKETSGEIWEATKETSSEVWEATKETSADAWDATREGASSVTEEPASQPAATPEPLDSTYFAGVEPAE